MTTSRPLFLAHLPKGLGYHFFRNETHQSCAEKNPNSPLLSSQTMASTDLMKSFLVAGVAVSVLFSGSVANAQPYNKDNDAQLIRRDMHADQNTERTVNAPTEIYSSNTQTTTQTHRQEPTDTNAGFYVGGFGGYSWTDGEINGSTLDVNGADYGGFVGVDLPTLFDSFSGLKLALEGHYAGSSADDMKTISGVPVTIEKDHEWGVSLRPGLSFMDKYSPFGISPYGIIGYRRTQFEASTPAGSNKEDFNGFELGIGTELIAYQDFGIRLDYSHVFYGEEAGIDPDENDLRLGVAYHF
ncbi:MAG TPA: outer membrane beta-barrel protein [Alphaproteobacteria bacterium]|nr:outer membrane beta-barrel protein [Alphaproteobacteria bacterium]